MRTASALATRELATIVDNTNTAKQRRRISKTPRLIFQKSRRQSQRLPAELVEQHKRLKFAHKVSEALFTGI
jgi:hypothetical protein